MTIPLAQELRTRLKEKGMSVSMLERKAGLKPDTARNIIRGITRNPRASNLQAIALVLGCSLQDLLGEGFSPPCGAECASSVRLEHFSLFRETVLCVLDILEQTGDPITLQTLYPLLTELYIYASELEPKGVDPKFVHWFLKKNLHQK